MDLNFPLGGLSERIARGKQEPLTTPDAVNVRGVDPTTGRIRGGTREPLARVTAGTVNGANPVREIYAIQYDNRGSTFAQYAEDAEIEEWAKESPLKQGCAAVVIDNARNRIFIDGRAGVGMRNAAGELVWKFVLPVLSQEHICRALAVDETGAFYVAVSAGHPQTGARVWKYRPRDTGAGEPNLEWSTALDVGGYVERIRLREGLVFLACNFPDRGAAEIRAYRLIDTAVPELAWTREQVPYPINSLDVRQKDGALLTCHEENALRAYDLRSEDTRKKAIDWTWDRLTSWDKRKWSWHDGGDIDGDKTFNSEYKSGDLIATWVDKTGNNRNWYSLATLNIAPPSGVTAPTISKDKTFGGYDTVVFAASTTVINTCNELTSVTNSGTTAAFSDQQLTPIPGYDDAWWAMWIVLRVENDTVRNWVLGVNPNGAQSEGMALYINANDGNGGALPPTADAGSAFWYVRGATGGSGTGAQPNAADYDNATNFVLIGIVHKADATATGSTVSIMGTLAEDGFAGTGYTAPNEVFTAACQLGRIGDDTASNTVTMPSASVFGFRGKIAEIRVVRDYLDTAAVKQIVTKDEFQRVEGELAWKYGIAHLLAAGHPYLTAPPTDDPLPGGIVSAYSTLTDTEAMLVKWDPNKARPRWVVKDSTATTGIGGLGYEALWPQNGQTDYCFSHGTIGTGTGGTATQILTREAVVRRIVDNGDTASTTGAGTWEARWGVAGSPRIPTNHNPKACVSGIAANSDKNDANLQSAVHLFLPYHTVTTGPSDALYIYLQGGTAAGTNADTPELRTIELATGSRGLAAAVELYLPEYAPGTLISTIDQYVSIGTLIEGSSNETLSNCLLVQETIVDANPRGTYVVAACSTAFKRVTAAGAISTPSGTSSVRGGNFVSIVSEFGRLWIADGNAYRVIDPRAANGIAREWKSKTSGSLPKNGRLLASWAGRLVIARGEDVSTIFFTAVGDPYNCNVGPAVPTPASATFLIVGSPVNALIPLSDDLLLIGLQDKIMRGTGNPATAGFQLDRVGDVQGIAFGNAWCKDPEGRTYFFGARGGVFSTDGVSVAPLHYSAERGIRRRLEDVDLSTYFVRMEWSWRMNGLHIVFCKQVEPSGSTLAFFWERDTGSWWQDSLPFAVTSMRLVDADDAAGRVVWLGCSDGHIRKFSETALNDDGTPLRWQFAMGPYAADDEMAVMVARPRVTLAGELGDAFVAMMVSEDGKYPTSETVEVEISRGLGDVAPIRARGSQVWVRLRGSGRMAYESGVVDVEPIGIRRAVS